MEVTKYTTVEVPETFTFTGIDFHDFICLKKNLKRALGLNYTYTEAEELVNGEYVATFKLVKN